MATMATDAKATQDFVPIKEVRDGVVVLKDGRLRVVVLTSSLNFALKSAETQNAIILQFQNFLNSLDFAVQIFVQSRRLDIRPYIALLEGRYKEQSSDLMRIQTREYIEFIKKFTENVSIMNKTFFVVIPYDPPGINAASTDVKKFFNTSGSKDDAAKTKKEDEFQEYRSQLDQRISVVTQGLVRMGIRAIPLGTEEVVELFYKLYNPGETEKPIQVT